MQCTVVLVTLTVATRARYPTTYPIPHGIPHTPWGSYARVVRGGTTLHPTLDRENYQVYQLVPRVVPSW